MQERLHPATRRSRGRDPFSQEEAELAEDPNQSLLPPRAPVNCLVQPGHEFGLIPFLQRMLPDAQDAPAQPAQPPPDRPVPRPVARERRPPEGGVSLGLGGVLRAAVPEAVERDHR